MHWFFCRDCDKQVARNETSRGWLARDGRFYLYWGDAAYRHRVQLGWSFLNSFSWGELQLRFGGEDRVVGVTIIVPWLAYLHADISVPRRWLEGWMLEDRVFDIRPGYIGDIVWISFAYAQWAQDCGMTDYYRRQEPRKYTDLQLWPGWQLRVRKPPILSWLLGRSNVTEIVVEERPVTVDMDGKSYPATWKLSRWETRRARWPWAYKIRHSSYIDVPNPPQFAGKGENSWDCGDDGIWGMGSRSLTPAGTIGDYIKAVLKNRERYGKPSAMRA